MDTLPTDTDLSPNPRALSNRRRLVWRLAAVGTAGFAAGAFIAGALPQPERGSGLGPPLIGAATDGFGGPLRIETQPGGASVRLDDVTIGTAPVTVSALPAGPHRLTLTAENHADWTEHFLVTAGQAIQKNVGLHPLPAQVSVGSPLRGARVWIDEKESSSVPVQMEVDAGERVIKVEADGYRSWEERVVFGPNERRTFVIAASGGAVAIVPADPSNGIAVMLDNQADARPQYGLNEADVVYEALVEGGITRYMALFLTREVERVGPVRSTRHYFVNWASEYLTPLMHIGASPQGYRALASAPIPSVDSRGFYRTPGRTAPHDALSSSALVRTQLRSRPVANFGGLHFRLEPRESAGNPTVGVRFSYGSSRDVIDWTHDAQRNRYQRAINGASLRDATSGEAVVTDNVVFLWMDSWLIPGDDAGRLDFRQVGSGRLLALTDGIAIEGTWSRSSIRNVTEYRDWDEKILLITPGSTWVQIIPLTTRVAVLAEAETSTGVSN